MGEESDQHLFDDVFGSGDDADEPAEAAMGGEEQAEHGVRDGKRRKEKKDKKEKKADKDRGGKGEVKEKKEKKAQKEKKEKKEQRDRGGHQDSETHEAVVKRARHASQEGNRRRPSTGRSPRRPARPAEEEEEEEEEEEVETAVETAPVADGSPAEASAVPTGPLLPFADDTPAEGELEAATGEQGQAKEKHGKKDKKDKKEKKDKKDKKEGKVGKEGKEGKEKKDKKSKKDKKDRKEKPPEDVEDGHVGHSPAVDPLFDDLGLETADAAAVGLDAVVGNAEAAAKTPGASSVDQMDRFFSETWALDGEFSDAGLAGTPSQHVAPTPPGEASPSRSASPAPRQKRGSHLPPWGGLGAVPPRRQRVRHEPEKESDSLSVRWAKVMESIKQPKPLQIKEAEAHPYIEEFVKQMVAAAEEDQEAYRKGEPMLKKMEMLPRAVAIMRKFTFAEIFVLYDGCRALALWLQELPDGHMPSVHLRSELLRCMTRLPINKEALANCRNPSLGKVVWHMQQNPRETVANRKTAGDLVQKWLRQVLDRKQPGASTGDDDEDEDGFGGSGLGGGPGAPKPTLERPPPETEESLRLQELESEKRLHPSIPVVLGKEYTVQPMPRDQPVRRDKVALQTNRGKVGEVIKQLAAPNKKFWRPYSVSVSGRTVNAI